LGIRIADHRIAMWLAILCGLVFYKFFMQILDGEDDFSDIDTSDSDASFAVAARSGAITVIYDVRIVIVVAVRNISGDGNWVDKKHKSQTHLNPVRHPF
ncbi:hypothetical protein BHE74_00029061, partial [Ensete ventricosum]